MKKELESLTGKLQHDCIVVKPGRSFLHQQFELQAATKKSHHHVPLWGACQVRPCLVGHLPGVMQWVAIILPFMPAAPPHHEYTDVAGGFGCGALLGRHWFQYTWPSTFQGRAIATQELLPIVMVCMIWGTLWANNMVVVHCDNQATVCVVNAGYIQPRQKHDALDALPVFFYQGILGNWHTGKTHSGRTEYHGRHNLTW